MLSIIIFIILFITPFMILIIRAAYLAQICKKQQEINSHVDDLLKSANFNVSKKLYLNDNLTFNESTNDCKKFIAVDQENKKICLINYTENNMLIIDFNEFLNYEIYENGTSETVGGKINTIGGGFYGAETTGICKDLMLIVRLKKYDIPQITYEIITPTQRLNKSAWGYKQCISTLQEAVSFLEVVKNENQTSK